MISLLGRESRRLPGIRASIRRTVEKALGFDRTSRQCRLFGSSDVLVFGFDDRRELREIDAIEGGEGERAVAQRLAAAGQSWRWASSERTWHGPTLPPRVFEVVEGLMSSTAGLLQHWASPPAHSRALPCVFPGFGQAALLPQSQERDQGDDGFEEGGAGEEAGEDTTGGLFGGGTWATSVKRKRVMKMRKHKWRKRRRVERQSASRRVNK